eukprot:1817379-Pyramimonas_sp.AAC.1
MAQRTTYPCTGLTSRSWTFLGCGGAHAGGGDGLPLDGGVQRVQREGGGPRPARRGGGPARTAGAKEGGIWERDPPPPRGGV